MSKGTLINWRYLCFSDFGYDVGYDIHTYIPVIGADLAGKNFAASRRAPRATHAARGRSEEGPAETVASSPGSPLRQCGQSCDVRWLRAPPASVGPTLGVRTARRVHWRRGASAAPSFRGRGAAGARAQRRVGSRAQRNRSPMGESRHPSGLESSGYLPSLVFPSVKFRQVSTRRERVFGRGRGRDFFKF